ncbi:MAG: sulfotransferase domain-containing protein [Phycisphaeraceae bacterium]|nr:sulfotransferase domain-containing protein [Phycisphaeraceae bacterium]
MPQWSAARLREALVGVGAPVIVASHPRSGTHLTIDLLRRQFADCDAAKWWGERNDRVYLPLEPLARGALNPAVALRVLRRAKRPVIKTHFLPDFAKFTGDARVWIDWLFEKGTFIYVYRDGRDVMSSLHHASHNWAPDEELTFGPYLRQQREGFSLPRLWAEHVERWGRIPGVRMYEYKQILKFPKVTLDELAQALGCVCRERQPMLPPRMISAWHSRWVRLIHRRPPSTALVPGKFFASKAPSWRDMFIREEDRRFFHDQAGRMLVQLGFETSDAWVRGGMDVHVTQTKPRAKQVAPVRSATSRGTS